METADTFDQLGGEAHVAGQLAKLVQKVSASLAKTYEELLATLPAAAKWNVDETGHPDQGDRLWTWCFRAPLYTLFHIDPSRGSEVLLEVLGKEFNGLLGCDYCSAYRKYMKHFGIKVQFCLAHLIRDVKFLVEHPRAANRRYGQMLLEHLRTVFGIIHRCDDYASASVGSERLLVAFLSGVVGALFTSAGRLGTTEEKPTMPVLAPMRPRNRPQSHELRMKGRARPWIKEFLQKADRLRLAGPRLMNQGAAEVGVGLGLIRLEVNGLAESRLCLTGPLLIHQAVAEVVVRPGEIGPEVDGLAVGRLSLAVLLLTIQGVAEDAIGLGEIGLEVDGFAEGRAAQLAWCGPRLL